MRIHTIGVSAPDTTGFNDEFIWRQGRTPDRLTSSDERVLRRILPDAQVGLDLRDAQRDVAPWRVPGETRAEQRRGDLDARPVEESGLARRRPAAGA